MDLTERQALTVMMTTAFLLGALLGSVVCFVIVETNTSENKESRDNNGVSHTESARLIYESINSNVFGEAQCLDVSDNGVCLDKGSDFYMCNMYNRTCPSYMCPEVQS